ncbi:hypothetical protein EVJ58_g7025 [Rhodofomes roseus]|uniref:Uncharacterized protein n=1 Tax=Rhodofomes roseus TaxID=34475 RepID=A0A4Y9Y5K1_9APHY|nr:hypothetical protein EVJ58_g7025 [Rhodofomes roseus]
MHDAGSGYSAPLSSNTPTADVGQYIMQEYEFAYTGTSYDTLSPQSVVLSFV